MPQLTVAQLQSLLTPAAMRCSPIRFVVDGREAEFVSLAYRCRTAEDGGRPAEVPTVLLRLTQGVGGGAAGRSEPTPPLPPDPLTSEVPRAECE